MKIDISDLGEVERRLVEMSIERLRDGQKKYGPWRLDSKDNFYERLCELIDATHYEDAETLKRQRRVLKKAE